MCASLMLNQYTVVLAIEERWTREIKRARKEADAAQRDDSEENSMSASIGMMSPFSLLKA